MYVGEIYAFDKVCIVYIVFYKTIVALCIMNLKDKLEYYFVIIVMGYYFPKESFVFE